MATSSGAAKTLVFVVILAAGAAAWWALRSDSAPPSAAPSITPESTNAESPGAQAGDRGVVPSGKSAESGAAATDTSNANSAYNHQDASSGGAASTAGSGDQKAAEGEDGEAIMSETDPAYDFELPPPPGGALPDPNPTPVDAITPVVLDTGVKYWDIKVGEGDLPQDDAMVICAYRAWRLTDRRMVDSSMHYGSDLPFFKSKFVPGLQDTIWSMRTGGIRQIFVPADQGWGETGSPPKIPPNADLLFEVQVKEIRNPPAPTSVVGISPVLLDSGLKYWDIKEGDGEIVVPRAKVDVRYTGWLPDGDVLDTTEYLRKPSTLDLSRTRVIAGFRRAVPGMRVGGKRRLFIPPELGYGKEGRGKVPPDATLVFEVDLVGTTPPDASLAPRSVEGLEQHTTDSGLIYWDVKSGDGAQPEESSTVVVHYAIFLSDETIYQTTRDKDEPRTLPLAKLMPGLREGISTMKEGGVRDLKVPPELGTGEQGQPPEIPPNETLLVEVELLEVKPAE